MPVELPGEELHEFPVFAQPTPWTVVQGQTGGREATPSPGKSALTYPISERKSSTAVRTASRLRLGYRANAESGIPRTSS